MESDSLLTLNISASPEFLAHYGQSRTPSELTRLPAVVYSNPASGNSINYRSVNGKVGSVNMSPAIYANTISMLLEVTKQGLGFCRLPEIFCAEAVKEGTLIEILSGYELTPGVQSSLCIRKRPPLKVENSSTTKLRLSVMKN